MYEVFEHTADVGIRAHAETLNDLFADAGRALFAVILGNLDDVRLSETFTFELQSDAIDFLLLDWLNELLYLFDARHVVLNMFEVQIEGNQLVATVRGEPINEARHRLEHEVKAITYHGLRVVRHPKHGWMAEVILDI